MTYYRKSDQKGHKQNWSTFFEFTLEVTCHVKDQTPGGTETGLLCALRHDRNPDRNKLVFIPHASFYNYREFLKEVFAGESGQFQLCMDIHKSNILPQFANWKECEYFEKCAARGISPTKFPVTRQGMQADSEWSCYAPELFFHRDAESVLNADEYMYFLLMNGHTFLSLNYTTLISVLKKLPVLFVVGLTVTMKTYLAALTVASIGTNAQDLCCVTDISEAAVKNRFGSTLLPLIFNDPSDPVLVSRIVTAVSEDKN
ncbi:hypothetical protein BV898_18912 [Hypsibius exemplaris]|uniref:Uncharacterized protein n=1 Tax=Hypsibius exemplaris TaxID=2072580 RepID=A0A9X6NIL6_HYPEX|nr:hypothetical protein BV898_18912 [Hypsibius exemplaris]